MLQIGFSKRLQGARGPFVLEANLSLKSQQITVLFGKSGAGKSTFLRILAGLERVDDGYISFDGWVWLDTQKKICLPPQKRPLGFVFQDGALFAHLNVHQNILFGNPQNKKYATEVIALMELEGLLKHSVSMLSGGQAQRVALARALVRILGKQDAILCLDEPLSALDQTMRLKLQEQLRHISAHFKLTTIVITHDLLEAYKLADNLVWVQENQDRHICQMRSFLEILEHREEGLCARVLGVDAQHVKLMLERQVISLRLDSLKKTDPLKEGDLWLILLEQACAQRADF